MPGGVGGKAREGLPIPIPDPRFTRGDDEDRAGDFHPPTTVCAL